MGVMNKFFNYFGLQEEEEIIERVREEQSEPEYIADPRKTKGNVVGLPSVKQTKMVLSEPRSYDETAR